MSANHSPLAHNRYNVNISSNPHCFFCYHPSLPHLFFPLFACNSFPFSFQSKLQGLYRFIWHISTCLQTQYFQTRRITTLAYALPRRQGSRIYSGQQSRCLETTSERLFSRTTPATSGPSVKNDVEMTITPNSARWWAFLHLIYLLTMIRLQ